MKRLSIATEQISARHADLDAWTSLDMVDSLYEGQLAAVAAVRPALAIIAKAIDDAAQALKRGGRLIYVGAGTSGRIAVQDGAELPPTFEWPPDRIIFALAGGSDALTRSIEGAEDDTRAGRAAVIDAKVTSNDVVIALAASGATPFTLAAMRAARARRAVTIAIANNAGTPLLRAARHAILVETGAEAVAGSTRMKAGTAQKIVINLLSTGIMIRLGRVHGGMMVQMRATNAKLQRRAESMVRHIAGSSAKTAASAVKQAKGDIKLAALLALGFKPAEAARLLKTHGGQLRPIVEAKSKPRKARQSR